MVLDHKVPLTLGPPSFSMVDTGGGDLIGRHKLDIRAFYAAIPGARAMNH